MSHMKVIKAETKKQQEQVLKILDELDYLWHNTKRPIRYIPSEDLGKKYIYIYCYIESKRLSPSTECCMDEALSYEEFISSQRKIIL